MRIATTTSTSATSPDRLRRKAQSGVDLWLLAQGIQDNPVNSPPSGETVLAAFPDTVPESIDDEVAKAYGLELVGRRMEPSLGLRIVRYRIPDNRPVATVVERLKADPRVSSAQPNIRYALPEQSAPPIEVSELDKAPGGDASKRRAAAAPVKLERKVVAVDGDRGQGPTKGAEQRLSSRAGSIGDVLAGGL